jgi:hypothetical protein
MKAVNTLILETDEMLSWYKGECLLPIEKGQATLKICEQKLN